MKDKYKNKWKKSELCDLVRNILIYGDKWDLICEKTGSRKEQKYKKHAKRFFIKNSFILHGIENTETTIDAFFEFKNNLLILNFSTNKFKYKEFKPENLKLIKRNFYKNLKSLAIEKSYFDEIYIQKYFNENSENEYICEINENQCFEFITYNNCSDNLRSNNIKDHYTNTKDSITLSDKRENNNNFQNFNLNNLGLNKKYFSNNESQSNNFFSGFKNVSANFTENRNHFENFNSSNQFTNLNFSGFNNFSNENNLSNMPVKDPPNLSNFNACLSFNNYFDNKKYENNEINTENRLINNTFENFHNTNNINYNSNNNFFFHNYNRNSIDNNNYNNDNNSQAVIFQSRLNENSNYNVGRSDFNNLNSGKHSNKPDSKKIIEKDYNMISLRILERLNSINRQNTENDSNNLNNKSIEKELIFMKPFSVEKVHGENRCQHNFRFKRQGDRRIRMRQVKKELVKPEKSINENENNKLINNVNIKDNNNNSIEMDIRDDENIPFKENTENNYSNIVLAKNENIFESKFDYKKEISDDCNKEENPSIKEFKSEEDYENNISNIENNNKINLNTKNQEDRKEEYVYLSLDNISRKSSDIFRLDKDFKNKKMSTHSIITQITQNNPNFEVNAETPLMKKPIKNTEQMKNLNINIDQEVKNSYILLENDAKNASMINLVVDKNEQNQNINQARNLIVTKNELSNLYTAPAFASHQQTSTNILQSFCGRDTTKSIENIIKNEKINKNIISENIINSINPRPGGLFVQKKRLRNMGTRRDSLSVEKKKYDLKLKPGRKPSRNCEEKKKKAQMRFQKLLYIRVFY